MKIDLTNAIAREGRLPGLRWNGWKEHCCTSKRRRPTPIACADCSKAISAAWSRPSRRKRRRRHRVLFDPEQRRAPRAARLRGRPVSGDDSQPHRSIRRQRADHPAPGTNRYLDPASRYSGSRSGPKRLSAKRLCSNSNWSTITQMSKTRSKTVRRRAAKCFTGMREGRGGAADKQAYVLESRALMTGEYIQDAQGATGSANGRGVGRVDSQRQRRAPV